MLALPASAADQTSDAVRALIGAAIDRGVPLFNAGSPEGCASVYTIAAASLVQFAEDELTADDRQRLEAALQVPYRSADEQAWGLRRAFDAVLEARPAGRQLEGASLMNLAETAAEWREVDDGVMGGVSRGRMASTRGGLRWGGTLSAENNGGFVSTRIGFSAVDLSGDAGLRLRLKGDGRTYKITLNTSGRNMGGIGYALLETTGRQQTIDLPWSAFSGPAFGGTTPLDSSRVESVQLNLSGKDQLGEFSIEFLAIEALQQG
jgi:monofunctional biosynthetic peptidoglycan transglycosylase